MVTSRLEYAQISSGLMTFLSEDPRRRFNNITIGYMGTRLRLKRAANLEQDATEGENARTWSLALASLYKSLSFIPQQSLHHTNAGTASKDSRILGSLRRLA